MHTIPKLHYFDLCAWTCYNKLYDKLTRQVLTDLSYRKVFFIEKPSQELRSVTWHRPMRQQCYLPPDI